jgi:hypothetical protein
LFIEHLSHSPVWKNSVVFVLEDDAQNGPDHVDAHRSIAFVTGPYVKRNYVDHTMYSTSGMLRTIELILGLQPMSQYDAGATPMYRCFTSNANLGVYNNIPSNIDLDELNMASNILSDKSDKFDLSQPDRVADLDLNEVIWKSLKPNAAFPAPRRAAFVNVYEEKEKD